MFLSLKIHICKAEHGFALLFAQFWLKYAPLKINRNLL